MHFGNRLPISSFSFSGEIHWPTLPFTSPFGVGMVSPFFSVQIKVLDSTRATSCGSVLANQLNTKTRLRDLEGIKVGMMNGYRSIQRCIGLLIWMGVTQDFANSCSIQQMPPPWFMPRRKFSNDAVQSLNWCVSNKNTLFTWNRMNLRPPNRMSS